jgi:hypothetical protein
MRSPPPGRPAAALLLPFVLPLPGRLCGFDLPIIKVKKRFEKTGDNALFQVFFDIFFSVKLD